MSRTPEELLAEALWHFDQAPTRRRVSGAAPAARPCPGGLRQPELVAGVERTGVLIAALIRRAIAHTHGGERDVDSECAAIDAVLDACKGRMPTAPHTSRT